jgi:hypothetical protein
MKIASSTGSGRTSLLQPNRLLTKPAAWQLQHDLSRQTRIMQFDRWEKTWSCEKLEMKTKHFFGKTIQKRLGVWAHNLLLAFTSHLEETSSLATST